MGATMHFTKDEETLVLSTAGFINNLETVLELNSLRKQYETPQRFYHTWQHALNVLSWVNVAALRLFSPEVRQALSLAALYHDAIYDEKGSPENEKRSADLLSDDFMLAKTLINTTALHGKIDGEKYQVSDVTAYFLDCDMAAFLCDPRWEVVAINDLNIRKELYLHYTVEQAKLGRAVFLKKLLDRRHIFLSKYFQNTHEELARTNLWHLVYG